MAGLLPWGSFTSMVLLQVLEGERGSQSSVPELTARLAANISKQSMWKNRPEWYIDEIDIKEAGVCLEAEEKQECVFMRRKQSENKSRCSGEPSVSVL